MENTSTQPPISPSAFPSQPSSGKKVGAKFLIILGLVVLVLGSVAAWAVSRNSTGIPTSKTSPTESDKSLANNTVVYGYWTSEASIINAYDMTTETNTILANLPSNIKHVKVISPTKIMFINKTDDRDYGEELVVRDLTSSRDQVLFTVSGGYGIDDFIVSSDGNYVALWQVAPPTGSSRLRGGRSQVVTLNVSAPKDTNVIYNEFSTAPVHYPVAVTNAGGVYLDRFLPNAEAGWAYGMSFSNFNGSVKEEIAAMQHGTYSSQPIQSPDGSKIVFAGYDGSKGSGIEETGGFRRALATPNTIEVYDLVTKVRTKLVSNTETIYPSVYWDLASGNVIYSAISKDNDSSGYYTVDVASTQSKKFAIDVTDGEEAAFNVYASLRNGKVLVADEAPAETILGNLGSKYAPPMTGLYALTPATGGKVQIPLNGEYVQFISLFGAKYFPPTVGIRGGDSEKDQSLQLQTFTIKTELPVKRQEQQSRRPNSTGPLCRDVTAAQCNELHGAKYTGDQAKNPELRTINPPYWECYRAQIKVNKGTGTCSDSPLYLYGAEGQKVNAFIDTTIHSPNVSSDFNRYEIVLNKTGFSANGIIVPSLSFDYNPAIKRLERPTSGVVIEGSNLEVTLQKFAKNLGLNSAETSDLVRDTAYIKSPYLFVSFYDNATSQKILPIYFDPQPDNYHNIVFYIEQHDQPLNASLPLPKFEKVKRGGFTAVEISVMVR